MFYLQQFHTRELQIILAIHSPRQIMWRTAFNIQNLLKNPNTLVGNKHHVLGLTRSRIAAACQPKKNGALFSDYSELKKPSADDGIFELKTCRLKPDCVDSYKKLKIATDNQYSAHAVPLWYWFTELGGLNESVTIWQYDSYAHRNKVQNALTSDSTLKEKYFSKVKSMLHNQTNLIMHKCPWYELQFPDKPGVYELGTYSIKDGKYDQVAHRLVQGLETRLKYSKPVGIFFTDIGPLSRLILLWHYEDLDRRNEIKKAAYSDEMWNETVRDLNVYINESHNKILVPASFSPRK